MRCIYIYTYTYIYNINIYTYVYISHIHMHIDVYTYTYMYTKIDVYMSFAWLLKRHSKIIGLFCKRALLKRLVLTILCAGTCMWACVYVQANLTMDIYTNSRKCVNLSVCLYDCLLQRVAACCSLHWRCYTLEIHQIEKLRYLGISRYKFKMRVWSTLNFYRGIFSIWWTSGV